MLKVAIVGCGVITTRKYIPIFHKLKNRTTLVGICDTNESALKQVAAMFNIRNTYMDFGEMILRQRPDIVAVCTPPATHTRLVIEALEKGSHVLVEKPMALTSADCHKMVDASNSHGRKLGIMHNQVFNPAFEKACDLVSVGAIGKFLGMRTFLLTPVDDMTSNQKHWAHKLPGGVLGETGPHAIYLTLALLNNVTDVHVCFKKLLPEYPWSSAEDIRFDLVADNGINSVTLMYGSNQSAAEIEIIGTEGMLKLDLQSRILIHHNRTVGSELLSAKALIKSVTSGVYQTATSFAINGIVHAFKKTLDGHYIGVNRFLDYVAIDAPFRASGEKGKETTALLETVIQKFQEAQQREGISAVVTAP
jgi:predicted dehydrogenase